MHLIQELGLGDIDAMEGYLYEYIIARVVYQLIIQILLAIQLE